MKRVYIALLLLSLFLLASCSQGPDTDAEQRGIFGSKENRVSADVSAFLGGTEALTFTYTEGNPPKEIFTGSGEYADAFDVELMLENMGEAFVSAEEIDVTLEGIDPSEFGKTVADFKIHPENELNPRVKDPATGKEIPSVPTYAKFEGLVREEHVVGNINLPLRTVVKYPYATKVVTDICVRANLRSTEEGVCNPQGVRTVQNSGAPVMATSFEQSVIGPKRMSLLLKIQHKGSEGIYASVGEFNNDRDRENKVWVEIDAGNLEGLNCIGLRNGVANEKSEIHNGFVELRKNEAIVGCELETGEADFVKGVNIDLLYGVKDILETSLSVKRGDLFG